MWKKLLVVVVILTVVLAAAGIAVSADDGDDHNGKSRRVNWRIAGPIFSGVQAMNPAKGEIGSFSLITLRAKGAPGRAQIEYVGTAYPVGLSDLCPDGTDLQLKVEDAGFVATFSDLSMLFFAIDKAEGAKNALCIDFQGPGTGVFDYVITGGTGRFENATGSATVLLTSWGISPALSAESGTIVGTIELP